MPGTSSKYKPQQTAEWEGEIMVILAESENAMTIDEIKLHSINLTNVTTAKMARILSHLIEIGMVKKSQSKSKGRMVYKSTAIMKKQGYSLD